MKLRFFTSIAFSIAFFIAMIIFTGNSLLIYTDIASFIAVIVLPHILISFIMAPSEQRKLIHGILSRDREIDRKLLEESLIYLKSLKRMILCCTAAAIILGVIGMMANLEDTSAIGPNFAVALIVVFYAAIYILIVIEPLRLTAERKLLGEKN